MRVRVARGAFAPVGVTLRGMSFRIARGAVNSVVCFGTAREKTTRKVTSDARIASSAVLHGTSRE
jgi:hypothetical protein